MQRAGLRQGSVCLGCQGVRWWRPSPAACSICPVKLGAREVSSTGDKPREGSAVGAKPGPKEKAEGRGQDGGCGPGVLGAEVRPCLASPVLRVIKNDSIDRFACCLLIYSDSFMGTAGQVPAGRPPCPPAARQPAQHRGTWGTAGEAAAGRGPWLLGGCWLEQTGGGGGCGPRSKAPDCQLWGRGSGEGAEGGPEAGVGETAPLALNGKNCTPIHPRALGLGGFPAAKGQETRSGQGSWRT